MTKSILVADDYPGLAENLSTCFEALGYRVWSAQDGATALEIAKRERPDVCVLDVEMPGLTGIKVALRLREELGHDRPLLIGISAARDLSRKSRDAFDYHAEKPCSLAQLAAMAARPKVAAAEA